MPSNPAPALAEIAGRIREIAEDHEHAATKLKAMSIEDRGHGETARELTAAATTLDRLAEVLTRPITDADVEAVEECVGMGAGAWDMVRPVEILTAFRARLLSVLTPAHPDQETTRHG